VAVVLCAHATLFLVDASFLVLKVRGFACGQLTALNALADALLLVAFALVDVVVVLAGGGGLREDDGRSKSKSGDEGKFGEVHDDSPVFLAVALIQLLPLTEGIDTRDLQVLW
jgi:hypothetical protein